MRYIVWVSKSQYMQASLALSALVLLASLSCGNSIAGQEAGKDPVPPDLHPCQYIVTGLHPCFLDLIVGPKLCEAFTSAELELLQSFEPHVVNELADIHRIADMVSAAVYVETEGGEPFLKDAAYVGCYEDDQKLAAFKIKMFGFILFENGDLFDYKNTGLDVFAFTPRLRNLATRYECARHLRELYGEFRWQLRDTGNYPIAGTWCDTILGQMLGRLDPWVGEAEADRYRTFITEVFQCPGAGVGRCHYAMNPNCRAESPPDTVLLFETQPGWNQHGGPELFTFDNHDPKGGCVLLNDGTLKFIRTEEELHELRWK